MYSLEVRKVNHPESFNACFIEGEFGLNLHGLSLDMKLTYHMEPVVMICYHLSQHLYNFRPREHTFHPVKIQKEKEGSWIVGSIY